MKRYKPIVCRAWLAVMLVLAPGAVLHAAVIPSPLDRPATRTEHAAQSALLDVTYAGKRLVAVGERGIVILSDDQGKTWRQARSPISVTLNAVQFVDAQQGWAVGHAGTVLHTADGGQSWSRQLDGAQAARLQLAAAQAGAGREDTALTRNRLARAEQLVKDGPDKPFLDLYFESEKSGYVVGAYNLIFHTGDGGRTWQPLSERLDNPKDAHLYGIRAAGADVYIAGEQGLLLRSNDGARSFARVLPPYEGSYFTLNACRSGELIVGGLRGNAFRSPDRGGSWNKLDLKTTASVLSVAADCNGRVLLATQAGQILASRDGGRTLQVIAENLPPVTKIAVLPDGSLLATSLRGVLHIPAQPK
jgi:photosystem II stability/assembly factor-like uncharacterized protein